jgi:hypothetical protein
MSKVTEIYLNLVEKGYTEKDAAKEAQARTGYSLVTQKPIKQRGPKHTTKHKWRFGEYDGK